MAACERADGATERGTDDLTMTRRDSAARIYFVRFTSRGWRSALRVGEGSGNSLAKPAAASLE
jgi:hypothetical protein